MLGLAIVAVLLVIAVLTFAMLQNGEYDNVSFGCLGFLGVFALAIIFLGTVIVS